MSPSTNTSQVLSTNDLRSHGVEYKRDHDHRHKWQFGQKMGPGRGELAHGAPAKPEVSVARSYQKRDVLHNRGKASKHTRTVVYRSDSSDVSADDEMFDAAIVHDALAQQRLDAIEGDVTYSFDAVRGATYGSQVLSSALEQAVEAFENRETEKLVTEEYEIVDGDQSVLAARKGKGKARKMKMKMPVSAAQGMISPRDEVEYEFV